MQPPTPFDRQRRQDAIADIEIAKLIRVARLLAKQGLRQFALSVDMLPSRLSEIEKGGRPTLKEFRAIVVRLNEIREETICVAFPEVSKDAPDAD